MASMAARAATTAAAAVRAVARAAPASAGRELHVQTQPPVQQLQYPWKEKLERFKGELSKGVWGYWHLGAWKPLALSARKRARLRKEVLLAGEDWPYDPARKEIRKKRKGHKCDRVAAEKRAVTAELMKKMPQMLLDYKKRRWEKKMKEEESKKDDD
ncbi:hypothetical protein IHE45_14G007300 [Dioscorea alata]|uniref:Uncharacterized protein n=1 Tax=Dioscorea alata TaxID=55571 RepID=A0ACB7UPT5_DIOAL|nr:hypothetical protein IHE45_14G007300 [Dioscorea alata]